MVVRILEDLRLLNTRSSNLFKVIKPLVKRISTILDQVFKNQIKIFR